MTGEKRKRTPSKPDSNKKPKESNQKVVELPITDKPTDQANNESVQESNKDPKNNNTVNSNINNTVHPSSKVKDEEQDLLDYFAKFDPRTDQSVLDEYEEYSSQEQKFYESVVKSIEEKNKKKVKIVQDRTAGILNAVGKATSGSQFNQRTIKQIIQILEHPVRINTPSGQASLKTLFVDLRENYKHFDWFLSGVKQSINKIRKTFELEEETQETQIQSNDQNPITEQSTSQGKEQVINVT